MGSGLRRRAGIRRCRRLDHAGGATIYIEEIIGEPVNGQLKLAYGHTAVGRDMGLVDIADVPARLDEQLIDLPSGVLFRIPHLFSFRFLFL